MAAGGTYTSIASYTATGSVSSYTFSSVPTTYTDIILVVEGLASAIDNLCVQVGNGSVDTGTNYSTTYMYSTGSGVTGGRDTTQSLMRVGRTSTANKAPNVIQFMNYSNTTTYKTMLNHGGTDIAVMAVSLWRSTSAINTIKVYPEGNTFSSGARLSIYGITAA